MRYVSKRYKNRKPIYSPRIYIGDNRYIIDGDYETAEEAHAAAVKAREDFEEGVLDIEALKAKKDRRITAGGMTMLGYEWAEYLGLAHTSLSRAARLAGRTVAEEIEDRLLQLNSGDPED